MEAMLGHQDALANMESSRKRKRGAAGRQHQHELPHRVALEEVPLAVPWVDLSGPHTPLPPGWEQCLDLQSGDVYFVNMATQRTPHDHDPRRPQLNLHQAFLLGLEKGVPSSNGEMNPTTQQANDQPPSVPKGGHLGSTGFFSNRDMDSSFVPMVCLHCHTFIMVSRPSPHCPNCRNLCTINLPQP